MRQNRGKWKASPINNLKVYKDMPLRPADPGGREGGREGGRGIYFPAGGLVLLYV